MALWKKLILAVFGTLIAITGGCLGWLGHLTADMCATTLIDQVPSSSGKLNAVVYQIDCGAASDFNSQVSIVAGHVTESDKADLPKSFFVADRNHGKAPEGKEHGPEIRLNWLSDTHLEIQHHEQAGVIRAEKSADTVAISYRTF